MCLGIPMKIVKIEDDEAFVESGGLRRKANVSFLKNIRIGEYVLIHAGFAIEKIKRDEAKKTLAMLDEIRR